MFIPNTLKVMEGESLWSYLMRTAFANGMDLEDFLNFYSNRPASCDELPCISPWVQLMKFCRDAHIQDPAAFLWGTTFMPYILLQKKQTEQAKLILGQLGSKRERFYSRNSSMKYCVECQREELYAHGFFWFHREHQVPSVTCCHIHKRVLSEARPEGSRADRFISVSDNVARAEPSESDIEYAEFVYRLPAEHIQTDISICRNYVFDHVRTMFSESPSLSDIENYFRGRLEETGLIHHLGKTNEDRASALHAFVYSNKPRLNAVLLVLFIVYLDKSKDFRDLKSLSDEDLWITRTCPLCGGAYVTIKRIEDMGIGCPFCGQFPSAEELLQKVLAENRHPYELVSYAKDTDMLTLRNKVTGSIYSTGFKEYVFGEKRPFADRRLDFDESSRKVHDASSGMMRLVSIDYGNCCFTTECLNCGMLKTYTGTGFSRRMRCPCSDIRSKATRGAAAKNKK